MSAMIDTLKLARRLRDAGASDRLAETFAEVLRETRDADFGQLVTKEFLRAELVQLEQRMTIKAGMMTVAAVGIVTAAVKLL